MIQKVNRIWASDTEAKIFSMFKDKPKKTALNIEDHCRLQCDLIKYCEYEFIQTNGLVEMLDRMQASFG